jgi:flavin-dependent dehydrogenase
MPGGWGYTARLPSGERVAACLADAGNGGRSGPLAPAAFLAALACMPHVRDALAGYALASTPRGADAGSARLASPVGDGWIAAGDAAVSFDPLSSHGILNALHTGGLAGSAVHAHLAGDATALAEYARHLDAVYAAYRQHLRAYYGMERRWPDHPFWARRHRLGPAGAADGAPVVL